MPNMENPQLSTLADHNSPERILKEVSDIYSYHYDQRTFQIIEISFVLVKSLFEGKFEGYRECNTDYHDLTHTMDAFLASARLMDGYNLSKKPVLSEESSVALLLAALYHDSGYIQESSDTEGTGAKYTRNHVERSASFVKNNRSRMGLTGLMSEIVASLIGWTGLKNTILENSVIGHDYITAGTILGTADLLGQMSDRAYLEKLLFLYYEFREAGIDGFNTEFDILKKTLQFYDATKMRLDSELGKSYDFARFHFHKRFGITANLYMEAIDKQMTYLKNIIEDDSMNFRHKLKRMDIKTAEQRYLV